VDVIGALSGVRVIDVSKLPAGQYCGRILADLGATVVKLEAAPDGDSLREVSRSDPRRRHLFDSMNAGKQSVLLHPEDATSMRIVADLIDSADVLLVSPESGLAAPWGIDPSAVAARNAQLITCFLTPYGMTGPLAGQPGGEAVVQALSGTAFMTGEPGGPPYLTGAGLPHTLTGMQGALAIGQALLARETSGTGQLIDIAMLDVSFAMDCANNPMVASERGRFQPEPIGRFHYAETIGTYRGRDGYLVIEVWGEGPDSTWARLARAIGRPDLIDDPEFFDDQVRVSQWDRIVPMVESWLQSFPSDDAAIEALDAAKVVAGRILEPHEAILQPSVIARGVIREVVGRDGESIPIVATPYRMPASPTTIGRPPGLGEHTQEVLAEWLGDGHQRARAAAQMARPDGAGATSERPRALASVKVLELSAAVAGPYAARLFVDLGADVIKVERPPFGDMQRIFHPPDMAEGAAFAFTSAGKQSLCIDVSWPEGRQIVRELVPYVDVVLENSTPGTMEKLGFSYEALRELNPTLVYCSVSGFGQDGPWAGRRATDPAVQAWSGLAAMIGEPDGLPYENAAGFCDTTTATAAAIAATFALYHRRRTGVGQHVEVSLLETILAADCTTIPAVVASRGTYRPHRTGRIGHLGVTALLPVAGRFVVVEMDGSGAGGAWERVARMVGRPDLVEDARFAGEAARVVNRGDLLPILDAWSSGFADLEAALDACATASVSAAGVLTPWEAAQHPQLLARGMVRDVPAADGPAFPTIATPAHFSETPIQVGPAAQLGQHNREILSGVLGYPDARIDELEGAGILQSASR
jgi:crotonobetainyl-CoA:carnitine CoA-transferase CaiB-like acyl-CoA transferase